MSLVALICPQCGGEIKIDSEREFGFCSFCGTKMILQNNDVVINLSVSQENAVTKESLFERAEIFLSERNFESAKEYFNKVLDIDPKFSKAYWGLLKSKMKAVTDGDLVKNGLSIKSFAEYNNASKFGTPEEKIAYEKISDAIEEKICEIEQLEKRLDSLKRKNRIVSAMYYLFALVLGTGIIIKLADSELNSLGTIIIGAIGAIVFLFFGFKLEAEKNKTTDKLNKLK